MTGYNMSMIKGFLPVTFVGFLLYGIYSSFLMSGDKYPIFGEIYTYSNQFLFVLAIIQVVILSLFFIYAKYVNKLNLKQSKWVAKFEDMYLYIWVYPVLCGYIISMFWSYSYLCALEDSATAINELLNTTLGILGVSGGLLVAGVYMFMYEYFYGENIDT